MKNDSGLFGLLLMFGCLMLVAIGAVHLCNFVDGPLRYSGFVIIFAGIVFLILINHWKLSFSDNGLEISSLLGGRKLYPYESIKSVEYIETKISGGNGIGTKVRNIRFNLDNGTSLQFAETQIRYKQCVKQLISACDNGIFPAKAIKPATRERLLNSINQKSR